MYRLKRAILSLFLTVYLSLVFTNSSVALQEYQNLKMKEVIGDLGAQPSFILNTSKYVYDVFCLGKDINFDGHIDVNAGEEYSSWWRIKYDATLSGEFIFQKIKVMDFTDDIIQQSFKPLFDSSTNKIYLNCYRTIKVLDLTDGKLNIENNHLFSGKSQTESENNVVLCIVGDALVTTRYVNYQTEGIRVFLDKTLNDLSFYPFECGTNTVDAQYLTLGVDNYLVILDQGFFGQANSALYTISNPLSVSASEVNKTVLGNGANSMIFQDVNTKTPIKVGYIVMNGDNSIVVTTPTSDEPIVLSLGEKDGYDGPRHLYSTSDWNYFYTTTYGSKLFVFDKSFVNPTEMNTKPLEVLSLTGKGEHMSFFADANYLLVATPLKEDYSALYSVDVFFSSPVTSVEDSKANTVVEHNFANIYPNPLNNSSKLDITLDHNLVNEKINSVSIYDINSNLVFQTVVASTPSVSLDLTGISLSNVQYFIKINFGSGFIVKPLLVNR